MHPYLILVLAAFACFAAVVAYASFVEWTGNARSAQKTAAARKEAATPDFAGRHAA